MTFRRALFGGIVALIVGLLSATAAAVLVVVERSARIEAAASLERSRRVFEQLYAYRQELYRTEARVVAEEPRIKAVVASDETTAETVHGVLVEMKKAIKCDLLLLTDEKGRIVADVADLTATGKDLSMNPLIQGALSGGERSGLWVDGTSVVQVHGRRMQFGSTVVGVLVLGHRLTDGVADEVERQTGTGVAVLLDGQVVARSAFDGTLDAALRAALAHDGGPGVGAAADLNGQRWLLSFAAMPGYEGSQKLEYVVGRSLDRALKTGRELLLYLAFILAVAGGVALIFAGRLARRLSQPVSELTGLSRRIATGDFSARATVHGPTEVIELQGALNQMAADLEKSRQVLLDKKRLEQEMEIATKLQTSLLPRRLGVDELMISARMLPATQVGGDYYDVIRAPGGAWIGIGDVAGHGLTAGIVMLMLQNLITALVKARHDFKPRELVSMLNEALYENVRSRLERNEFTTLTLLRYYGRGRIVWAGAHEVMLRFKKSGGCEELPNLGTWVGAMRDIGKFTVDSEVTLEAGDLLVLYTDGITEAMNGSNEQFGLDRFKAAVEAVKDQHVDAVREAVLTAVEAFAKEQVDDRTIVVVRYAPPAG